MGKTIQIRDVDDHAYAVLRTRAAAEGMSLTAYLKRELERLATRATMAEWLVSVEGHRSRTDITTEEIVAAVHEGRRERDEELWSES